MSKILLGCIADDFTGATDLANNLVRAGMRVVQTNGVPTQPLALDVDAVVIALKTRTISPAEAIAQSLAALQWLKSAGSRQIYFSRLHSKGCIFIYRYFMPNRYFTFYRYEQ